MVHPTPSIHHLQSLDLLTKHGLRVCSVTVHGIWVVLTYTKILWYYCFILFCELWTDFLKNLINNLHT
jgi:hypothetical protein